MSEGYMVRKIFQKEIEIHHTHLVQIISDTVTISQENLKNITRSFDSCIRNISRAYDWYSIRMRVLAVIVVPCYKRELRRDGSN